MKLNKTYVICCLFVLNISCHHPPSYYHRLHFQHARDFQDHSASSQTLGFTPPYPARGTGLSFISCAGSSLPLARCFLTVALFSKAIRVTVWLLMVRFFVFFDRKKLRAKSQQSHLRTNTAGSQNKSLFLKLLHHHYQVLLIPPWCSFSQKWADYGVELYHWNNEQIKAHDFKYST